MACSLGLDIVTPAVRDPPNRRLLVHERHGVVRAELLDFFSELDALPFLRDAALQHLADLIVVGTPGGIGFDPIRVPGTERYVLDDLYAFVLLQPVLGGHLLRPARPPRTTPRLGRPAVLVEPPLVRLAIVRPGAIPELSLPVALVTPFGRT